MPIDESNPIYIGSNDRRTNDYEKIVARSLDKFPNWVQLIDLFTSVTGQRDYFHSWRYLVVATLYTKYTFGYLGMIWFRTNWVAYNFMAPSNNDPPCVYDHFVLHWAFNIVFLFAAEICCTNRLFSLHLVTGEPKSRTSSIIVIVYNIYYGILKTRGKDPAINLRILRKLLWSLKRNKKMVKKCHGFRGQT